MADLLEVYPQFLEEECVRNYDFDGCWTRCNPGLPYEEADVVAALILTDGDISASARLLGRTRRSLSGFVTRSIQFLDLVEDLNQAFLDAVETRHKKAALQGDLSTQRFFLQTRAKNRGYTMRTETTGADGSPIAGTIKIDSNVSDDFLEQLMNLRDEGTAT